MSKTISSIRFIIAASAVILPFCFNTFAQQGTWLDLKPLPSWNERKRYILQTKEISPDELKRCSVAVRQPTLPQDRLLTKMGWTLVGPAQIFGNTTVITTAEAFDGMCRPLKFENYVFVGNRVAGTLAPGPLDSRTDGAVVNVKMVAERNLTAEFVRYRESDPLCCPYKIEAVTYVIKPDGANFLLVPEGKFDTSIGGENRQSEKTDGLKDTAWRWEALQTRAEKITVPNPANYTLKFMPDGKVQAQVDCNRGVGGYKASGSSLTFSGIGVTRAACAPGSLDSRFLQSLEAARIYKIDGDAMLVDLFADSGTMQFVRISPLENTTWRLQSVENANGQITVDKPENYQIEFSPNGALGVKADCNVGGSNYKTKGGKLTISSITRTMAFCGENSLDNRFVQGLEKAHTFRIEGNFLLIEGAGDKDTLKFFRVYEQK